MSEKSKIKTLNKIAAVLALFIGGMSVLAGSMVLLGIDTKYYTVLIWLVIYNVIFGVLSLIAAFFLWQNDIKGKYLTFFILIMHFSVLLYLKFINEDVATESIKAMVFRNSVWFIIVLLSVIIPNYLNKKST